MKLSTDQEYALNTLLKWFKKEDKRFITLGGYAGTGKTTLISFFTKNILSDNKKLKIAFCSYTGKAVQNLKNKLQENELLKWKDTISTIHGLIYEPIESSHGEIIGWLKKEDVEFDLIIVDEASMLDEQIWADLLSYNIPIIAVGDHGQLPPIKGKFNLMQKPQLILEKIHRQAESNPIIRISEKVRKTGNIESGEYSGKVAKYLLNDSYTGSISNDLLEGYTEDTLILCGYNNTRTKLNQFIRTNMGFESQYPEPGDRVICLRNNHKKAIYNGMLGTIQRIITHDKDWYDVEILMDDLAKPYIGLIYGPQFGASTGINFTKDRKLALKGDLFDFGYALTVHKAQGSQAKRVILFEERFKQMDDEMWRRWLYTGITRAEEELYVFGN